MKKYIINKNTHEVHCPELKCGHLPNVDNSESLGRFNSLSEAVKHAKSNGYDNASKCEYCKVLE